ncbi:MAG: formate--tetrahydrofolate ligase [Sandaracinaceae bacterium]
MLLRPVHEVADELGLAGSEIIPYGQAAKIPLEAIRPPRGKLVAVSAITPTPAGEGKTTVSISLGMALRQRGVRTAVCLREPSLGPIFGIKGGGTGGGKATLEPSTTINLHFTGDLHAIGSAHNLLAALTDNDLHFRGETMLDPARVTWPRVVDMNDRSLRNIVVGLHGEGVPRETRFDITAASEVMAALCLAEGYDDLTQRLGRIVIGARRDGSFVTAGDLGAPAAMTALLRDALMPNLVRTAEGGPAIVHGGPFANLSHGCSSVLGTRLGLGYADVVVTEGGFGFDLGGEKLLDLKCRSAGLWPHVVVLVATLKALRMHGGAAVADASKPDPERLRAGLVNLDAHLDSVARFGIPAVVAINRFGNDPDDELAILREHVEARGVPVGLSDGFAKGGEGALPLADVVMGALEKPATTPTFSYPLESTIEEKLQALTTKVYGGKDVALSAAAKKTARELEAAGYGQLPICVAKTHRSLSDDPRLQGRPQGFTLNIASLRLLAGAGYITAIAGELMTMPGLPRVPASTKIRIGADGEIEGV